MKLNLLLLLLVSTKILFAQTFTEIFLDPPLDGVYISSIAFSDVNGDGHEDVLITGLGTELISKLYTNDGEGNFTELMNTPFQEVIFSSIAFSDVNGDGHDDVLITGLKTFSSNELIAKLYTNDGQGNFTEQIGTPFEGVYVSSIAFSDVNGDGYDDVLITGQNNPNAAERIAKLYTNDGEGNFIELMDTPFERVRASSIAFSDVNGDSYDDVLITGENNSEEGIAKLYTNDGQGNFTELMDTPFEGVDFSSIAFSDVNGDGYDDVLITGENNSEERIAKLYTNDGQGNFTELIGTPFEGVFASSIAFSDVNGDGHDDVLITGQNNSEEGSSKLYTNDGQGNFTELMDTPFEGVDFGSIAFSDVNGDGKEDILITGENNSDKRIAKLYTNDGTISSTDDLKIQIDIELFPNPTAASYLNLQYTGAEIGVARVNVYDINGVLLRKQNEFVAEGQQLFPIDISSLSKGNYMVELIIGEKRGTSKFVIQ